MNRHAYFARIFVCYQLFIFSESSTHDQIPNYIEHSTIVGLALLIAEANSTYGFSLNCIFFEFLETSVIFLYICSKREMTFNYHVV